MNATVKLTAAQRAMLKSVSYVRAHGATSWAGSSYSVLDALVAKGMIARVRSTQRKWDRYQLTDAGRAALAEPQS